MRNQAIRKTVMLLSDALIVALICFLPDIAVASVNALPECVFYKMGISCPTCGATSAIYHMASGNFARAFGYNPMIFLLVIYLAVVLIVLNAEFLFGSAAASTVRRRIANCTVVIVLAVCYAIFGVLRNLF